MAYKDREEQRIKQAAYHQKMKTDPQYKAARKETQNRQREQKQKVILEYLLNNPCLDCGERDPIVLEFDHLKDKFMGVGAMLASNYSLTRLMTEVSKCEVVCCNCHQRRTAKRANFWKLRAL